MTIKAVDVSQCLAEASKLVALSKPQFENVTCAKDVLGYLANKDNQAALNLTLTTCGVPVPVVSCNQDLK
jgi:predicted rRNA methylase YqxC with S4 and FtsJ domains